LASIPPAPAITVAALRRISNRVLSGGLYRGPRKSSLRNKAVCKDAVCSFVYHRARSDQLTTAMPLSTGPPQSVQLDSPGQSLQTDRPNAPIDGPWLNGCCRGIAAVGSAKLNGSKESNPVIC